MRTSFYFLLIVVVLNACSQPSPQQTKNTPDTPFVSQNEQRDTLSFTAYYSSFTTAIRQPANDTVLSQFIDPHSGFWVLEASGAMPSFEQYTQLSKVLNNANLLNNNTCTLAIESLPQVDCDRKSLYTKEGCFAQQVNAFAQQKIWQYTDLSEQVKIDIEKLANTIDYTVIETSGYTYYFSKINNNWYLSFIDLRKPCNA